MSDIFWHPARIFQGKSWYISFYQLNPKSRKIERFRRTFGLNRIDCLDERLQRAEELVSQINALLPFGYPFTQKKKKRGYTLIQAFDLAFNCKISELRSTSMANYRSHYNHFTAWLRAAYLDRINVRDFERTHAQMYMNNYLISNKPGACGYNNKLQVLKSLFSELVDQEIIENNPFCKLKMKKHRSKKRRSFFENEKKAVAKYAHEHDPGLYIVIAMIYYCMIRPAELRRLRIRDINLSRGVIIMSDTITKNKMGAVVTIPNVLLNKLIDRGWSDIPSHYFLFSKNLLPGPTQCGKNQMNLSHSKILRKLKKTNILKDIKGLTLYSWKDTGDMELLDAGLDILTLRDHNRHKNIATTNAYLNRRRRRNDKIANLPETLLIE